MSGLIDLNLNPDARTLRQFGWIALAGFGGLALLAWNEWLMFAGGLGVARPWAAGVLATLAGFSALFSLLAPQANRLIYVGLSLVAYPIGFVLSYAIMGILFYGLFAPLGFWFRLTGRDPMKRRFDAEAQSYWVDARATRPPESYFKQF